jgi:hypothetical protein
MDLNDLKPDQIKDIINILSKLLPNEEATSNKVTQKRKSKPKQSSAIKTNKSKAKSDGINFFDTMREKDSHKEDTIIDQKLNRYPPTERNRHFESITVQCRCCGRKEKINPGLLIEQDRYKCNKCSISAG